MVVTGPRAPLDGDGPPKPPLAHLAPHAHVVATATAVDLEGAKATGRLAAVVRIAARFLVHLLMAAAAVAPARATCRRAEAAAGPPPDPEAPAGCGARGAQRRPRFVGRQVVGAVGALHEAALPQNISQEEGGLGPSSVSPNDETFLVAGQVAGPMVARRQTIRVAQTIFLPPPSTKVVTDLAPIRGGARQEGPEGAVPITALRPSPLGARPQVARASPAPREAGASVDVGEGGVLALPRPPMARPVCTASRARVPAAPGHVVIVQLPAPVHDAEGSSQAT